VAHAPDGELAIAVVGNDSAVWQLRERQGAWTAWERIGGVAQRVAMAESAGALTLFTLDAVGAVERATLAADDAWSAFAALTAVELPPSNPIGPAASGPLQATFTGKVAFQIPSYNVSASRAITLGLSFDADRQHVSITSFPAITTDPFSTPLGSTNSTVTLIGGGTGTFDPSTGNLDIPVKLHFDQSINIPLINADVDADFDLNTQQSGAAPLDRASGALALGAAGTFTGSGLNPLAGAAADLIISGVIDPVP
jgi:hypothetical protein